MMVKDFDRQEKISAVTRIYTEIGVDKMALQKIEFYFGQGLKFLEEVGVADNRKTELCKYAEMMMKRQY